MDRHSTIVVWAKTLLPLLALALLSTLFLFARAPAIDDSAIPSADIEVLAQEQRVSAPAISGVASDGSILEMTAESARPEGETLHVSEIRATIHAPGGALVTIRAGTGEVDTVRRVASLSGLAQIETSTGYAVETAALTADFDSGRIETLGPLEAQAPFGELTAGRLVIETPEGGGRQLDFRDGVRLVYLPPSEEGPDP